MNKTVKEIVKEWLVANGYGGLYSDDFDVVDCTCALDDLMPCDCPTPRCSAGYTVPDPTGAYDYIIVKDKP